MSSKLKKTRKICRRRRKEGEIATRGIAIRNFCLECVGYNSGEVSKCSAKKCWLYPYRMGAQGMDSECVRLHMVGAEAAESTK